MADLWLTDDDHGELSEEFRVCINHVGGLVMGITLLISTKSITPSY